MAIASQRAAGVLALCAVLSVTPACVMRYLEHKHLRPYTAETTTAQDVVYTAECAAAVAVTIGTLGAIAPLSERGTLWFRSDDDEDDDDRGGSSGSGRKRVNPNNQPPPRVGRPIGRRRTR